MRYVPFLPSACCVLTVHSVMLLQMMQLAGMQLTRLAQKFASVLSEKAFSSKMRQLSTWILCFLSFGSCDSRLWGWDCFLITLVLRWCNWYNWFFCCLYLNYFLALRRGFLFWNQAAQQTSRAVSFFILYCECEHCSEKGVVITRIRYTACGVVLFLPGCEFWKISCHLWWCLGCVLIGLVSSGEAWWKKCLVYFCCLSQTLFLLYWNSLKSWIFAGRLAINARGSSLSSVLDFQGLSVKVNNALRRVFNLVKVRDTTAGLAFVVLAAVLKSLFCQNTPSIDSLVSWLG